MATPYTIDPNDPNLLAAISQGSAQTAMCRSVVPKGPDHLNVDTVTVPRINPAPGGPIAYGADQAESTVNVYVNVDVDNQHTDPQSVVTLMQAAGAALGILEDKTILHGVPARPPAGIVRRTGALPAGCLLQPRPRATGSGARAGTAPNATQITAAISSAMAAQNTAGRPGSYGLILQNEVLAVLNLPAVAGGAPAIQAVEQLINSNQIAGTSELDRSYGAGEIWGVLLRLQPPAAALVQTQTLAISTLGLAGGTTHLRVEEDIALEVLDPTAIHGLEY